MSTLGNFLSGPPGDSVAIADAQGRRVTHDQLAVRAGVLTDFLNSTRRPFVALLLHDEFVQAEVTASCLIAGAPGFNLNPRAPLTYLKKIINQFGPSHLLMHASAKNSFAAAFGTDVIHFTDLPALGEDMVCAEFSSPKAPSLGTAWMLMTSGSTGERKGVQISAEALRARTENEVTEFSLRESDRLLNFLTFEHDLGLNQLLTTLRVGARLEIRRTAFVDRLLDIFLREKFDGLTATPLLWRRLLALASDQPALIVPRFVTVSGGGLPLTELRRLRSWLPKTSIIRTYGQTETFRGLIDYLPESGPADLGFQSTVRGVSLQLDPQTGELSQSGPANMIGYFGEAPAPTRVATGDLFRSLADGRLEFIGRKDDLRKRFDQRISCLEIESLLLGHGKIKELSVVLGAGDKMTAFFVAVDGHNVTENELRDFAVRHLPNVMVPDRFVKMLALPLTGAFKIDREALRFEMG